MAEGRVIRVTYQGSPGSRIDQPESGEGVVFCPECRCETDGWLGEVWDDDTTEVECAAGHWFRAGLPARGGERDE